MNDLPKGWEWKKLGEISECLDSQRIPLNSQEREAKKGNIPYYGANGQVDTINEYIFDEELLLVAEDGGSWGENEKCTYIIREKSWVNNHAHVLRMKPTVLIKFLESYLNKTDLTKYISGTTRGKLNQKQLNNIEIPVPSLQIQHKIVATLERAEKLKSIRQEANDETNTIIQSLFYEMFGDPIKNEKNWTKEELNKISREIQTGFAFGKFDLNSGVPHLRPFNISENGLISLNKIKYVPLDKIRDEKYFLVEGDIIINTTNSEKLVGKTALYNFKQKVSFSNHNTKIRATEKIVNSCYLWFVLQTYYENDQFNDALKRWVNQVGIDINKLKNKLIPVPPISLQNQFASIVEKIESIKEHQRQSTQEIKTLSDALMQKAFKGELHI